MEIVENVEKKDYSKYYEKILVCSDVNDQKYHFSNIENFKKKALIKYLLEKIKNDHITCEFRYESVLVNRKFLTLPVIVISCEGTDFIKTVGYYPIYNILNIILKKEQNAHQKLIKFQYPLNGKLYNSVLNEQFIEKLF